MRKQFTAFLLAVSIPFSFAFAEEKIKFPAPSELPNTNRSMKTAGFWISQHPSPDALIMPLGSIEKFNANIRNEQALTKDIFSILHGFKTESLITIFEKALDDYTGKGYYTAQGVRDDRDFVEKARKNMYLSGVTLGQGPRYGLVLRYTNQRFFPTSEGLYAQKDDIDFDELQNSALDVGTPVAVVHTSADRKWYYVFSTLSDGWVEAKDIALGEINDVKAFAQEADFIVSIKPKADVFTNEAMTNFHDYIHMGVRLPLAEINDGKVKVHVPSVNKEGKLVRREAFMNEADIHVGFLPYTPRSIYTQAFAMLNQPYGWGDMHGEQDCSRLLQMVFATAGIELPRDSKNQAQVGTLINEFTANASLEKKAEALKTAVPAISLLTMRGHIMLYVGSVDDRPYAIHATSGYRQRQGQKDITRSIHKVAISDLSLGEGSSKGSLLRRLQRIVEVR